MDYLTAEPWLRHMPRRIFSLLLRFNEAGRFTSAEAARRRLKLRDQIDRAMQDTFPASWHVVGGMVEDWIARRQLHASVEELWHCAIRCAGLARRAGEPSRVGKWIETAKSVRRRVAGQRTRLLHVLPSIPTSVAV